MRRRMLTGQHAVHQGVNATPLIDVVMCLIIFFLLVGKLASDRGAAVRLPESARGHEEQAATILVVTVTALPSGPIVTDAASPREGGFAAIGVEVEVDGKTNKDAAWFYPETKQAANNIKGYVAFWRGVTVEK